MDDAILQRRFQALAAADRPVRVQTALALYDELPAVELDELHGDWDGRCVRTGHPGEAHLEQLGWVGKRVHGRDEVDPLICRDPDGRRVTSAFAGSAALRRVEYREVLTATIVYDARPYLEHFRRVSDDVLLAAAERKGEPEPLIFWLRRVGAQSPRLSTSASSGSERKTA
jgi:hypothetical protein